MIHQRGITCSTARGFRVRGETRGSRNDARILLRSTVDYSNTVSSPLDLYEYSMYSTIYTYSILHSTGPAAGQGNLKGCERVSSAKPLGAPRRPRGPTPHLADEPRGLTCPPFPLFLCPLGRFPPFPLAVGLRGRRGAFWAPWRVSIWCRYVPNRAEQAKPAPRVRKLAPNHHARGNT